MGQFDWLKISGGRARLASPTEVMDKEPADVPTNLTWATAPLAMPGRVNRTPLTNLPANGVRWLRKTDLRPRGAGAASVTPLSGTQPAQRPVALPSAAQPSPLSRSGAALPRPAARPVRGSLDKLESLYKSDTLQIGDVQTAPLAGTIICALNPRLNYHTTFVVQILTALLAGTPAAVDSMNMALFAGSPMGGAANLLTGAPYSLSGQVLNTGNGQLVTKLMTGTSPVSVTLRVTLTQRDWLYIVALANATGGVTYQASIVAAPLYTHAHHA